ncbi:MAG TPA: AMP-binding protein, partial [Pyrinomonadaceae bacterium]|nr:AMP-binding protein [Pyrinomonadaceae bacterium]
MSSAVAAKGRGQSPEVGAQESEVGDLTSEASAPKTLAALCLEAIARHNKPDAVSEKRGDEWVHISAEEFVRRVRHIALGLSDLGIHPGDRVALISENRPEWSIADLAILSIGAVTVPIYTTQAVDQIQFILTDSGTRALMISGGKILKHAREGFDGLDQLEHVVVFDSKSEPGVERATTLESI